MTKQIDLLIGQPHVAPKLLGALDILILPGAGVVNGPLLENSVESGSLFHFGEPLFPPSGAEVPIICQVLPVREVRASGSPPRAVLPPTDDPCHRPACRRKQAGHVSQVESLGLSLFRAR